MGTTRAVRARPMLVAALLGSATVVLGSRLATALPDLSGSLNGALDGRDDLATVVTEAAHVLVLLGGAFLALTGSQVAVGAFLSGPTPVTGPHHRPTTTPRWWWAVVLAACGTVLLWPVTASGSTTDLRGRTAAGSDDVPPLTGLPLPDLPETATGAPARPRELIVVRPGDSLWAIATRTGPPDATDAEIARQVARLYADNRGRIGPDPDLIHPGTTLHGGAR